MRLSTVLDIMDVLYNFWRTKSGVHGQHDKSESEFAGVTLSRAVTRRETRIARHPRALAAFLSEVQPSQRGQIRSESTSMMTDLKTPLHLCPDRILDGRSTRVITTVRESVLQFYNSVTVNRF